MAKKNKTVVYVVDFQKKQIIVTEHLTGSNSKKEKETIERLHSAIDLVQKTFRGSKAS